MKSAKQRWLDGFSLYRRIRLLGHYTPDSLDKFKCIVTAGYGWTWAGMKPLVEHARTARQVEFTGERFAEVVRLHMKSQYIALNRDEYHGRED
jgi:hypothetical protein